MRQKRKGIQKQTNEEKKLKYSNPYKWDWKRLAICSVVLVLAVAFAFPEINQFIANSFKVFSTDRTLRDAKEGPGEAQSAEISPPVTPATPSPQQDKLPSEIENFEPTYQKTLSTKKIFFEGRRIAPIKLSANANSSDGVGVYLFEHFLSPEECDGLRAAHDKHVKEYSQVSPLLCFESVDTLKKHLSYVKRTDIKLDSSCFTSGSYCLNSSFSSQVAELLNYNWSYSTAFYPGESPFSTKMAALVQETTGLKKENGGKFQITSYPLNIGYKRHTDCVEDSELRDRMATVLVYLDDVESGGETEFPELGIKVKPRKGQALVWNNMDANGRCLPLSIHQANKVTDGRKYILQRWYYYKSFWSLGRRPEPPSLPKRTSDQALVLCDEYKRGSCRWYDEWLADVMVEYRRRSATLI